MKTLTKGILTTILVILAIGIAFGQKGVEDGSQYGKGEDSLKCLQNLSVYREYTKQGNYALALNPWKNVYNECPKATKYVFIDGIKMIELDIKKEKDPANKKILVDSMMRIYDNRVKYFGQKGYVIGLKGVDYIQYSEKTVEDMQIGYDLLKESIQLEKHNSGPAQLLTFFQACNSLYQAKAVDAGVVVADFGFVMEIAENIIKNAKKEKDIENMKMAKAAIEKIFEDSGAANCDDLVPFYAKKFKETPEDIEFLTKATNMLRATKCTDAELYFKMADKLNTLAPSSNLSYELARMSIKNEKLENAARYYKQAIELEVENVQKAKYYLELGDAIRKLGNLAQARTYALNSIELDPTNGYPYLLIGHIYAAASKSCAEEDFHQKAVYWAAVDKYIKAKTIDPSLTDEANKYIETYRAYFPDNESIFFYGLKQGDTYTVECWINEKTTVRAR